MCVCVRLFLFLFFLDVLGGSQPSLWVCRCFVLDV